MTGKEMGLLGWRLERQGFAVRLFRYPSRSATVSENAHRLAAFVHALGATTVHFVSHSLGGLVVARCHATEADLPAGRSVALGTPFNGSYIARALKRHPVGCRALGSSVAEPYLETGLDDRAGGGNPAVISGTVAIGIGMFCRALGRPNDGTVAVAETQWPFAAAQLTCATSHFGLLLSATVAAQVAHYLKTGIFSPQP